MLEAIWKGITFGLILSISVGPVIFAILKQSLNNGHRGGMAFIIGVAASDVTILVICNVFTVLFTSLNEHKKIIGICGSIFLLTIGIYFLFFKKVKVDEGGKQVFKFSKKDYIKIGISGFLMNGLNPGAILFWFWASTTVLPHTMNQRIIIFITCLAMVFSGDIAKVMLADKIRKKLTPHNIHIINRLNGLILFGFGIVLLWGLFYSHKIK